MKRYVCVHGHFYQPPREDPWSETVPLEVSAAPFHDWNQKITAECYLPNTEARILDREGKLKKIFNNFSHMSFDVGPTLLSWLKKKEPLLYEKIILSDQGNAMAQAYNHLILPLANSRDKETQLIWGLKDFEYRFGRPAHGLWLPETAVDLETLEIMARLGIRFTLLAPQQAQRFRFMGETEWTETKFTPIDPLVPYRLNLSEGRSITLFFFHGPLSRGLAFEGLLRDGEALKKKFLSFIPPPLTWPRLLNVVTDGETFGHHHRFGEMALAYVLSQIIEEKDAALTNYAEFLERFPPEHEVEIQENTSWSCLHGIERWRSDCGCHLENHPGWNQAWRKPLREAFDWLRDAVLPLFEKEAKVFLIDPWAARNDFISLWLDEEAEPDNRQIFFRKHARQRLKAYEEERVIELMELQRHLMFMYTSCGWFFDDPAGLETSLVLRHAVKALEMSDTLLGKNLDKEFFSRLGKIKSNDPNKKFSNKNHLFL
jgi:alpha-amylase/alpha-mannosidase (GH57 family)